jgi:hypothetical protein
VRFKHGFALLKALGRRFITAPVEFFLGARDTAPILPDESTIKR